MTNIFFLPKFSMPGIFLLLFIFSSSFSQETTRDFKISLPEQKSNKSIYNKIQYIDSRKDSLSMGFVQVGAFNQKAKLICSVPLKSQLENAASVFIYPTLENSPVLCFQLRKLLFCETNNGRDEFGIFIFRANLYKRTGNAYQLITAIDTSIVIKAMDVTKKLMETGGLTITDFLVKGLFKNTVDTTLLSIDYVRNIDRVEKLKLKLYTTTDFIDGIYSSYASFSNQVCDFPLVVDSTKKGGIILKTVDGKGNITRVENNKAFAFVYKGQPFIVNGSEYCKLVKKEDEFRFNGNATVPDGAVPVIIGGGIVGGAAGGIAASILMNTNKQVFEMELDHKNGSFIPIRKLH